MEQRILQITILTWNGSNCVCPVNQIEVRETVRFIVQSRELVKLDMVGPSLS